MTRTSAAQACVCYLGAPGRVATGQAYARIAGGAISESRSRVSIRGHGPRAVQVGPVDGPARDQQWAQLSWARCWGSVSQAADGGTDLSVASASRWTRTHEPAGPGRDPDCTFAGAAKRRAGRGGGATTAGEAKC
jgi:hypothetical protein